MVSRQTARQQQSQRNRLSYGQTGATGEVLVANPRNTQSTSLQNRTESTDLVDETQQDEIALTPPKASEQTTGGAQPAIASDELALESPAASQLKTRIDGPQHAVTGEEAEYQVLVENASSDDVDNVLVQLAIPTGLEVTVLDRDAWFDGKARTITWKLPKVAAGERETIRYLAKVVSADGQLQKVTLGAANQFRGQAIFQSTVMEKYELAAPLMEFEKEPGSLK